MINEYNITTLPFYRQTELEVEFLELWPTTKVSGTLLKGKDSQLSLTITTPTLKHLLEGRLLFSETRRLIFDNVAICVQLP